MSWFNNEDNRRFLTRFIFVAVSLLLLAYLNSHNSEGEYKELIVGIIGIFIGVASTAAKDLISGGSESQIKNLQDRVRILENKLTESEAEKNTYKRMIQEVHDKLVKQSGILNIEKRD